MLRVVSGKTGHVEVYDVDFTGGALYYEAMVKFFFQFHDPTTLNKQGKISLDFLCVGIEVVSLGTLVSV